MVIHDCVNIPESENRLEWPQEDDLTIAATITLFENRGEIVYHYHYSLNMIFQSFQHHILTLLQKANTTLE